MVLWELVPSGSLTKRPRFPWNAMTPLRAVGAPAGPISLDGDLRGDQCDRERDRDTDRTGGEPLVPTLALATHVERVEGERPHIHPAELAFDGRPGISHRGSPPSFLSGRYVPDASAPRRSTP